MINLFLSLGLAYLIGSIPTSFIFTKIFTKLDIRKHGSGNVGATNVFRVVGKVPAIMVLVLDILKGVIAVTVIPDFLFNNDIGVMMGLDLFKILLGMGAISGHVWSVFLKFKGGKGVATTAGVLLIIAPKILAGSALIWVVIFVIFRIVSIASIAASIFIPIFSIIFYQSFSLVVFSIFLGIFGTYKHKANIKRLFRGEEKKLF